MSLVASPARFCDCDHGMAGFCDCRRNTRWREQAACRGLGPDMFYLAPDEPQKAAAAKELCMSCPVRVDCAETAVVESLGHGIWGGLAPKQRRRRRKLALGKLPPRSETTQRQKQARAMDAKGEPWDAIARQLGVSVRTVRRYLEGDPT